MSRVVVRGLETGVASAFTWFADSQRVAFVSDARIAILDLDTKRVRYVTERAAIRPEACVVSPNNRQIAFVGRDDATNQICVAMV